MARRQEAAEEAKKAEDTPVWNKVAPQPLTDAATIAKGELAVVRKSLDDCQATLKAAIQKEKEGAELKVKLEVITKRRLMRMVSATCLLSAVLLGCLHLLLPACSAACPRLLPAYLL